MKQVDTAAFFGTQESAPFGVSDRDIWREKPSLLYNRGSRCAPVVDLDASPSKRHFEPDWCLAL